MHGTSSLSGSDSYASVAPPSNQNEAESQNLLAALQGLRERERERVRARGESESATRARRGRTNAVYLREVLEQIGIGCNEDDQEGGGGMTRSWAVAAEKVGY